MTIDVHGKKVAVTDKNARAYKKMNGFLPEVNDVEVYINATYHPADIKTCIESFSDNELTEIVNFCIEQEIKDCCGIAFYEEA